MICIAVFQSSASLIQIVYEILSLDMDKIGSFSDKGHMN